MPVFELRTLSACQGARVQKHYKYITHFVKIAIEAPVTLYLDAYPKGFVRCT